MIMEFRVSHNAAKFFVKAIVVTAIVSVVRVESLLPPEQQNHDDVLPNFSSIIPSVTPKLTLASSNNDAKVDISPNTLEPTIQEALPAPSKKYTRDSLPGLTWIASASRQLAYLLSPGTLSRANFFQYLISETLKLPDFELNQLSAELNFRLTTNEIPEIYNLLAAKRYIKEIQTDPSYVPPKISSPPKLSAYGLFSSDIFSDPDFPLRLLNKLLQIPKSHISNLIIRLEKYTEMQNTWNYSEFKCMRYKWYAYELLSFVHRNYILDDLKRDMNEIQRISKSSQNSVDSSAT